MIVICFHSQIIGQLTFRVQEIILFDKPLYHPGDIVEVTISNLQTNHSKLRSVELYLYAYEEVTVIYRSNNGNYRRTQQINYANFSKYLEPHELGGTHNLHFQLPKEMPSSVSFRNNLLEIDVMLGVEIKYDISMATDDHRQVYTVVLAPPRRPVVPIKQERNGLIVSMDSNLIRTGQTVNIRLETTPAFQHSYRGVRVELEEYFQGSAHGRTTRKRFNQLLTTMEQIPPSGVFSFVFPQLMFQSNTGAQFAIDYEIKIVIDRKLAGDDNIEIPITYSDFPGVTTPSQDNSMRTKNITSKTDTEITCINCGNAVSRAENYCTKCGTKIID